MQEHTQEPDHLPQEGKAPPPEIDVSESMAVFGNSELSLLAANQDSDAHTISQLLESAASLHTKLDEIIEKHTHLEKHLDQLQCHQNLLDQLSEQNRRFQEQHHERHVLFPLMRVLISVADRCRDQIHNTQSYCRKLSLAQNGPLKELLKQFLDAHIANLIEVENRLADFGIVRFCLPTQIFDPVRQTLIDRIAHHDPGQHRKIARRLRPGYRRNDTIIRHECVSVYFVNQNPNSEKEI